MRATTLQSRRAFTLVELLVVLAVVATLMALLIPSLGAARTSARLVVAHSDLRQIGLAIDLYSGDNKDQLPPTRSGCAFRSAYEPPPELAVGEYLPSIDDAGIVRVLLKDPFTRGSYRFRAPGAMIMNEVSLFTGAQGSKLFIPDDYPVSLNEPGAYVFDPVRSPIRYAIWSMGPRPESRKLAENPGRAPVLRRFWMTGAHDDGIVTHIIGNGTPDLRSPGS
ncbi:MAG: prepilin-type N-terminal cleavage/methylation domain-containing protein [Planctomycetota bacterium]|nr:prepilin-type N-terminal cleavage/methylation domain-containing protein [Planctomycetota bacterium]